MEYPVFRTERVRRAGIERRDRQRRERFDFVESVLAHVKEVRIPGHYIKYTAARRRHAQLYLASLARDEGPTAISEMYGVTPKAAEHAMEHGPDIVLEVIRSGVLGPIEGWGLEVVAECERRLA